MDNSLRSREGEELSDAANLKDLVISHLTNRVYMGVEGEAVIKKDPEVPGSARARVIITYSYGRCTGFISEFGVDIQKFCFTVI